MIPPFEAPANRRRRLAAALWVVLSLSVLTWWVKGELEMAWLAAFPLIPGAGVLAGLSTILLLGRWKEALSAAVGGGALGVVLLVVAINTPHGWSLEAPAGLRAAADSIARERDALEQEARRALGLPVEVSDVGVEFRSGRVQKEGFSFRFTRREPAAELAASFDAGPAGALFFDLARRGEGWEMALRTPQHSLEKPELLLRRKAFERRLPGAEELKIAGGTGPHAPGERILVAVRWGADDWGLVLFEVGGKGEAIHEVRRYGAAEIRERFQRRAHARGLGAIGPLTTVGPLGSTHGAEGAIYFNATLAHPDYAWAQFVAAPTGGDEVAFDVERTFTRPRPGEPGGGDRRGAGR
jgi:hypothetical protein